MTAINEIAVRNGNIPIIEDAAQCFGATHHGKKSCSLSLIGATSFFPSKPLGAYGDGGALFTDDDALAAQMRAIRVHGQTAPHYHEHLGITGRFDSIQAAVVLTKLSIFEEEIERRNQIARSYSEELSAFEGCQQLPFVADGNTSVWAQFTILASNVDRLSEKLNAAEIPSVSYYRRPLHLQPVFSDLGHQEGDFPVAEKVASAGLSLPMNPYLTDEEIARVCSALKG